MSASRVQLVPEEFAVLGADQRGGADPAPTVDGRSGCLAAGLGPLHGASQLFGCERGQDLVVIDVQLGAEPASDLGGDHSHRRGLHSEGRCDRPSEGVRDLSRAEDGELPVTLVVLRHNRAGLDGDGNEALVDHLQADDHRILPFHGGIDLWRLVLETKRLPIAVIGPGMDDVRVQLVVDLHLVRCSLLQVDHRGEDVVIDLDCVGRILCLIAIFGDHHRHRLTDMVDLTGGEQRAELPDRHLRHQRAEMSHVIMGVDGDHSGHRLCCRRVERSDLGSGHR